ncbi:SAP domain protein [Necator americanus]|uniref:SAP domain protein n=1 Tax=Necator americanus TaxID=51031 RepID=W2TVR7_NECAM|nr:SAP domain protein [Necator americanus]ETN86185.1 SAP domain protein [Necator americanus]
MSVDDPLVNGVPLSSLRVVDLKDELDKRGLSKIGNKSTLTERLKTYICENEQQNCGDSADLQKSPAKVGSPENPLVAAYLARQAETLERQKKDAERIRSEKGDQDSAEDVDMEEEDSEENPKEQGEPMRKKLAKESEDVDSAAVTCKSSTSKEEHVKKPSPAPKETTSEDLRTSKDVKKSSIAVENKKESQKFEESKEAIKEKKSKEVMEPEDKLSEDVDETSQQSQDNDETNETAPEKNTEEKEEKMDEDLSRASSTSKHGEENGSSGGADHLEELDYGEVEVEAEPDTEEKETKDEVLEVDESEECELHRQKRRIAHEKEADAEQKGEKKRKISPSRHPESDIIHIRGLTRPFTDRALKAEILKCGGQITDFWIDSVKSHCIVQMRSVDEAREVRIAMHNTQWPTANPKTLSVQFDTKENMERHRSGQSSSVTPATPVPATRTERKASDRERPVIGTLPGRNPSLKITVEAAMRENEKREGNKEKERRERARAEKEVENHRIEKDEKREKPDEKRHHEDKHSVVSELSLEDTDIKKDDRERKRHRSETPPFSKGAVEKRERRDSYQKHDRDHDREHDRGRERDRERERYDRRRDDDRNRHHDERDEEKEKEREEKPVKTADSLFMKTKTLPAIYFLPLTDEEVSDLNQFF